MKTRILPPSDPYDTEAWLEFYAANPGWRRGVGAEGVNDDDAGAGDDDAGKKSDDDAGKKSDDDAGKKSDDDAGKKTDDDAGKKSDDGKPSEEEARLLRDVMRHKQAAKDAADKLKTYEGVDPEEYRALKKAKTDAETAELEAKGQFEEVKRQMREAHETELTNVQTQLQERDQTIEDLRKQIQELTVGSSFSQSKYLTEQTVLPAGKARAFYGDHFEIEDGRVVAYDKPKGAANRSPLVDGKGDPLHFEAAIEKIVLADPDSKDLLRANIRPGAGSKESEGKHKEQAKPMSRQDKIKAGLGDLLSASQVDPMAKMLGG